MKKILTIALFTAVGIAPMSAQYYSVNIDYKTAAAMVGAYGTETAAEAYYSQQVEDILKKYTNAEMAAAGIFSSKYLDRKALTDMGIWVSPDETTITAVSTSRYHPTSCLRYGRSADR